MKDMQVRRGKKYKKIIEAAILLSPLLALFTAGASADTLADVKARGVFRWGADAEGGAPYVYQDPKDPDKLIGFEVDLAQALAARWGVRAEMVQNNWDGLIPALGRGSFDFILNGLEITPEHLKQVAMSKPYYIYSQQIVTAKDRGDIKTQEDLKGKKVGVLSASMSQRILEKMGGVTIVSYAGNSEPCRDLRNGRLDASLMDYPIALYYAKPYAELKFSGKPFAYGYYGMGVLKKDAALLNDINLALDALLAEGKLKAIYKKWGMWEEDMGSKMKRYGKEDAVVEESPAAGLPWGKYLWLLLKSAVVTVELSVISMVLAVGLGLALALARLYGAAPLRWLSTAYVEVVRGTPLLIQLYILYYGLPNIGIKLTAFIAAILGLGMNYAAYEAENYRAGIQAIPRGQMEAAMSLGMTRMQAVRHVILPQAMRIVIPPISNDFIALFKDSSLVSVITMVELTKMYGMLANATYNYMGLGLLTAAIYFGLSYPASLAARHLEKKLAYDHR
ncbi:MAG: ABC transporter substrate-binding protein/permease [Elusimicrobiota bacterium]|nr:ABC transporter substrate-binding protein/permease [Elusimicrobiota bacterium]